MKKYAQIYPRVHFLEEGFLGHGLPIFMPAADARIFRALHTNIQVSQRKSLLVEPLPDTALELSDNRSMFGVVICNNSRPLMLFDEISNILNNSICWVSPEVQNASKGILIRTQCFPLSFRVPKKWFSVWSVLSTESSPIAPKTKYLPQNIMHIIISSEFTKIYHQ